jgi:predicted nucleic acid-binding Zn ribbon protein
LIYEYECPGDGQKIEIEFPITAVPQNVMCSLCGTELKRIFTAPANNSLKVKASTQYGQTNDYLS